MDRVEHSTILQEQQQLEHAGPKPDSSNMSPISETLALAFIFNMNADPRRVHWVRGETFIFAGPVIVDGDFIAWNRRVLVCPCKAAEVVAAG